MWNHLQGLSTFALDPIENNFDNIESSMPVMNNYDVHATWQSMLQEQQRQLLIKHQATPLTSFYSPPLDYYYPNNAAPNCNYSTNFSSNMKDCKKHQIALEHQSDTNEKSGFVLISDSAKSSMNLAASVSSEQNGSTSCEESDICDNNSNPGNNSPSISSSQTNFNNDETSRKRKQYWRQVWYRERNKEYSRNWRSKKKQEEESLKSEINALRSFKEIIEESLNIHIHSTREGLPFTYTSNGFNKLLNCEETKLNEIHFLDLVCSEDLNKVKQVVSDVLTNRDETTIKYKIVSPNGAIISVSSKIRYTNKGLVFITSKDQ